MFLFTMFTKSIFTQTLCTEMVVQHLLQRGAGVISWKSQVEHPLIFAICTVVLICKGTRDVALCFQTEHDVQRLLNHFDI